MSSFVLPPHIERCSCDEALALRQELARVRSLMAGFHAIADHYADELLRLRVELDRAERECRELRAQIGQLRAAKFFEGMLS